VKVYAIKSNCDLQVHPGILKGVHLSELTGKKIIRARKWKIKNIWTWQLKSFLKRLKNGKNNSKALFRKLEKREKGLKSRF